MSLAIDCDAVEAVLLADGWHGVVNHSFAIVAYEFVWQGEVVLGVGQIKGLPANGAQWVEENGDTVTCPLTAVLAIRWSRPQPET